MLELFNGNIYFPDIYFHLYSWLLQFAESFVLKFKQTTYACNCNWYLFLHYTVPTTKYTPLLIAKLYNHIVQITSITKIAVCSTATSFLNNYPSPFKYSHKKIFTRSEHYNHILCCCMHDPNLFVLLKGGHDRITEDSFVCFANQCCNSAGLNKDIWSITRISTCKSTMW